ncbi:MAG: hypothetical protein JKY48_00250 [Flavobacteriales bacterium]|nr:hypothetical protein [Flavobacteriales bacterium]
MRRITILFFACLFTNLAFSQSKVLTDDTLSILVSGAEKELEFKELPYYELNVFQQYRPFGKNRLALGRSGNLGLSVHRYTSSFQDWNTSSLIGGYQMYLFQKDSLKYYKMSRPFTQLSYVTGAEEEQQFQVLHSQNLGEGMNLSFEYQRITSKGFYIRQLSNHTQFNSTINLKSRNQRFFSRAYFLINNFESQENGGVFISEGEDPTKNIVVLDINLRSAQNQSRTQSIGTKNEYNILETDSTKGIIFNVSHEINWDKAYRRYSDDVSRSPNYYDLYIFDQVNSADSSFSQSLSNSFFANFLDKQINVGFRNEQIHYFQNSLIDQDFTSNFLLAELNGKLLDHEVIVYFEKGLSGFHKEELDWKTTVNFKEFWKIRASFEIYQTKKRADYLLLNQRANHHYFSESFATSDQTSFIGKLKVTEYNLVIEAGFKEYQNYIYLDSLVRPQQHKEAITSFHVSVQKNFVFLKHWNLRNTIQFQDFSNNEIIPLPALITYHSLYYGNAVFKKSLTLQVGADLYYIGKYKGYAYSPSMAQFHLRNSDQELGNIVQVDLFLNLRINKSARIFFKMENITANSFSENTFRIQDYPIPGRTLKIGLSWRMIN